MNKEEFTAKELDVILDALYFLVTKQFDENHPIKAGRTHDIYQKVGAALGDGKLTVEWPTP